MDNSVFKRKDCRLCGGLDLSLALPVRPSPIGDAYISRDQLAIEQRSYPLSLYMCHTCGHIQLPDVVDPEILFSNYTYATSSSPGLVEHFRAYSEDVIDRVRPLAG